MIFKETVPTTVSNGGWNCYSTSCVGYDGGWAQPPFKRRLDTTFGKKNCPMYIFEKS